jgi:hypothetical protein
VAKRAASSSFQIPVAAIGISNPTSAQYKKRPKLAQWSATYGDEVVGLLDLEWKGVASRPRDVTQVVLRIFSGAFLQLVLQKWIGSYNEHTPTECSQFSPICHLDKVSLG